MDMPLWVWGLQQTCFLLVLITLIAVGVCRANGGTVETRELRVHGVL